MKRIINTRTVRKTGFARMIAAFACVLMITISAQPYVGAQAATTKTEAITAAEPRLSASATKIWLNGKGSVTVTIANRKAGETVTVTPADESLVSVKIGKWKNNKVNVAFTPLADATTTVTVSFGDESIKLTLVMKQEKAMTAEEVYSYLHDATVEIKTWDSEGNVYIGAGFFVGDGQVLTDYHVVSSASKMTITDYNGKTYKIKSILGYDEAADLILIRTSAVNKAALTIATDIKGGMRMYAFGSPAGVTATFSTGIVSNPYIRIDGNDFFQSTMPSGIGSGGGPMVNEYGQVLGIMTLTVSAAQNLNFGIRYDIIRKFLDGLTEKSAMGVKAFYKENAGKIKESNDYGIFGEQSEAVKNTAFEKAFEEKTPEELYVLAHDAMVDVLTIYEGNLAATGSGFFINEDTVVTCAHVLSNGIVAYIRVTDYNDNIYVADLENIRMNRDYDVAILTVKPEEETAKHTSLTVAPSYLPTGGETVYAFGSPSGYSCTFSSGITVKSSACLSKSECMAMSISQDLKFILFSAPIYSGSSGGVLLNKYGQAIGITSGLINVTENLNLAIQIDQLSKIK